MNVTITNSLFARIPGDGEWTENGGTFRVTNGEVVLDGLLVMSLEAAVKLGFVRWNEERRQLELVEPAQR